MVRMSAKVDEIICFAGRLRVQGLGPDSYEMWLMSMQALGILVDELEKLIEVVQHIE